MFIQPLQAILIEESAIDFYSLAPGYLSQRDTYMPFQIRSCILCLP